MAHPALTLGTLYAMIATELFGATSIDRERVGLELELLAFARRSDGSLRAVTLDGEENGLRKWLARLAEAEGWEIGDSENTGPIVRTAAGGTITLEPAGQVEYSGPPLGDCGQALEDLDRIVEILTRSAGDCGIELHTTGYNGQLPEREQSLQITKPRYRAMDRYFARIGPFGRRMMRSTCALQINLDFGDPGEAPERWRLANMIAPSLNAIFANSPLTIDGKHYRSYRYEIWRHVDPTRTGRLFDRPDLDPIDDYLRFALDAKVMLVRNESGELLPVDAPMTFREWIAGRPGLRAPDAEDWRVHLGTLFPDVRPRGYLEIRSVDALPSGPRDVAVAMVTALIYSRHLRHESIELLELRQRTNDPGEIEHGGCWQSDYRTGRELLEMALPAIESERLRRLATSYLETVLARGLTPGDRQQGS